MSISWENEPDLEELRRLYAQASRDPAGAVSGLTALAHRGSVASMMYLADIYIAKNPALYSVADANYWYEQAEKCGNVQAAHALGRIAFDRNDFVTASEKFFAGKLVDYPPSIYRLAHMHLAGNGVPTNKELGRKLLAEAATKGHVFAKRDLMSLYLKGDFGMKSFLCGLIMPFSLVKDIVSLKGMATGPDLDRRIVC